jgi:hypothetical protein
MVDLGHMQPGKGHSQMRLNAPGLCPVCLERYVRDQESGGKTDLVEEVVAGLKTRKWVCPYGGPTWYQQGGRPFVPPMF